MGSSCSSQSAIDTSNGDNSGSDPNSSLLSSVLSKKEDDCKSLDSSGSERSRPPTPFSRPLTGRVAQRPRTTTIFEREDQKGGSLGKQHSEGSLLTVTSAAVNGGGGEERGGSRSRLGEDEAFPRKNSHHMKADEKEIKKLKAFLKKKGL